MNNTQLAMIGIFGIGLGLGLGIGHVLTKRQLEKHYIDLANEEIKDAKEYYETIADQRTASAPDGRERIFYSTLSQYQGAQPVETDKTTAQRVIRNIFREPPPEDVGDFSEEVEARTPDHPYIIAVTEYLANDSNYSQETLTWYEGDGALIDDQDDEVNDPDGTIGLGNLRFGHRSDQDNVVYIRNDRLHLEFEVLRHEGKYSEVVLGLIAEGP